MNSLPPFGLILVRVGLLAIAAYIFEMLRRLWHIGGPGAPVAIAFLLYPLLVLVISFVRSRWARITVPAFILVGYVIVEVTMEIVLPRQFDWQRVIDRALTGLAIGLSVGGYFFLSKRVRNYYDRQKAE
jgi:hypothetical protein